MPDVQGYEGRAAVRRLHGTDVEEELNVGVHLTDAHARFTFPDGKTDELRVRAGEVRSYPAGEHLPENLGDQPLELVFVELKARPVAKKPARVQTAKRPGGKRGAKRRPR